MPPKTSATWARICQRAATATLASSLVFIVSPAFGRSKLQGVGQASLGFTDNVRSSPKDGVVDPESGQVLVAPKSADAFVILSPSLVYGLATSGSLHRLSYTYNANLYFQNSGATRYSNRLEWRGFMEPSPRLQLMLTASATQAHQHTQGTLLDSSQTALSAAIPGTGAYVLGTVDEGLVYSLSPEWSFLQGVGGAAQVPVFDADGAKTYQASARLGLEHLWEIDAAGVETRARYVAYRGAAVTSTGLRGDQSQLINEFVGTWRHDWSYDWSTRVEAGAAHAFLITRDREFWQPIGLAGISYVQDDGQADLYYRHAITTSVFLGLTFLTDEVRLHGSIPLDKHQRMFIAASAGYQHSRILDPDGELATNLNLVLGDVAFGYRITPSFEVAARYQHVEQLSGADLPPLPLSYVRNTALLTATLEYPPDQEMPRTYRAPQRVDRTDAVGGTRENPTDSDPGGGPQR